MTPIASSLQPGPASEWIPITSSDHMPGWNAWSPHLSIGRMDQTGRGLAAARDKVIFNMSEMSSSIWMTELADGGRRP